MTASYLRNILVTGATGFIGSHLCRELVGQGSLVFGLIHSDNTENIKSLLQKNNFHPVRGNIEDVEGLSRMMKESSIDTVLHLAARLPHEDDRMNPYLSFDVNIHGTLNLLQAASVNRVPQFIYSSSIDVYSDPPEYVPVDENHPTRPRTDYGIGKLTGELYASRYSGTMGVTILRYSIVYGKGGKLGGAVNRFIHQAQSNQPMTINGDGSQSNDFVSIGDVVRANCLALDLNKPGIYNIGSGEETTVKNLARTIIELTRSSSEVRFTGEESNRPFRFSLDINRAKEALGFESTPLRRGLAEYISQFR